MTKTIEFSVEKMENGWLLNVRHYAEKFEDNVSKRYFFTDIDDANKQMVEMMLEKMQ